MPWGHVPPLAVFRRQDRQKPLGWIRSFPAKPSSTFPHARSIRITWQERFCICLPRPKVYFGQSLHDSCRRASYYDAGLFLEDWNDPAQQDYCLYQKGCKGPDTYADCSIRRWNEGINYCNDCGAGCQGCAEPGFYQHRTPLFTAESEVSKKIWAKRAAGLRSGKNKIS